MPTLYDIHPSEAVTKAAELLKKDIKMPSWAVFVKTSSGKQNPPDNQEWYYKRAASILKKVYVLGPIGTNKLRIKYGTKKNRGHAREEFRMASGKIIRSILQQLEKTGYVKKEKKGAHSGRMITPKGKSFLDTLVRKNESKPKRSESGGPTQPAPKPAAEAVPIAQAN